MADRQKGKQHDEECALQVKVFPVRSLNYCLPDSDAATVLIKLISYRARSRFERILNVTIRARGDNLRILS